MDSKDIQSLIDEYYYWDARVIKLECNYFGDEVALSYDNEGATVNYYFYGCYKIIFDHIKNYNKLKPVKNMTISRLSYFLQDVKVSEITDGDIFLLKCMISMFPLEIEIWCKDINIFRSDELTENDR